MQQITTAATKPKHQKPKHLDALTGLRFFAALNIVFFHFSDPHWFGPFTPIVNAGYASVSFFILLSGFVLAYNYAERAQQGHLSAARFWTARWTRLYPVYLFSLLLSWGILRMEWGAHTHTMFWLGAVLTPLLLQGWVPEIATFWNTPAWTMSAEAFFYGLFPWLAKIKRGAGRSSWTKWFCSMAAVWLVGMLPGALYVHYNPDGLAQVDRFSYGPWLQALKFTPLPHFCSFFFGILLATVDAAIERNSRLRLWLGLIGFAGVYGLLQLGPKIPYALIHDGLLMPLFGCMILALAGHNLLARFFSFRAFVFVGESSYCLYLLHFNLWNILHQSGILNALHITRLESRIQAGISYVVVIAMGLFTLHFIERPAQRVLRRWLKV